MRNVALISGDEDKNTSYLSGPVMWIDYQAHGMASMGKFLMVYFFSYLKFHKTRHVVLNSKIGLHAIS